MATIEYEKVCGAYLCEKIQNDSTDTLKIIFKEPFSGILELNGVTAKIRSGIATLKISEVGSGVKMPAVYSGGKESHPEAFVIHNAAVYKKDPDGDYVRSLGKLIHSLTERVDLLEVKANEITEKIQKTIL